MKISRLMEITTILLNRKTIKAAELAKRFEVSVRTIYRDIETLSLSGIPVITTQGRDGGISLMDTFTLNRTVVAAHERESIVFALQSLQATKFPALDSALEKLGAIFSDAQSDWISIDFSPWGSDPNEENKFDLIKNAILQNQCIQADYYSSLHEKTQRKIAPLCLQFKAQAWYLQAFCFHRQAFRLFRISRLKCVQLLEESFPRSKWIERMKSLDATCRSTVPMIHLIVQFHKRAAHRIFDDYNHSMITDNKNGTYTVAFDCIEDDWMYGYLLSFGNDARVCSPLHVCKTIQAKSIEMTKLYESAQLDECPKQ